MNPEEYRKMYELEDRYWYFQGRKDIIGGILDQHIDLKNRNLRVLDVGCGTGLMLGKLMAMGLNPIGADLHELSMQYCRKRGAKNLTRADVTHLPFSDDSFDLILALDLIEHVEDDNGLLKEFRRVAAPGAKVLITVPSHPFLWSEHDDALMHYRRYQKAPFLRQLRDIGLKPIRYSYAIALLYFPIVAFRLAQRLIPRRKEGPKTHLIDLPKPLNLLLIRLLQLEGKILRKIDLPFGLTILALAEVEKSHQ
jgi:SAM-dependent methyltransferase